MKRTKNDETLPFGKVSSFLVMNMIRFILKNVHTNT